VAVLGRRGGAQLGLLTLDDIYTALRAAAA
jgi:hypothetical protein